MATPVQPSNNSELQLYRVLQRANLLQYFETFITQGGDDVQQLCEAGEDEFLEIMALVGMASKPLHVRRLQKALQEWVLNPSAYDVPKKIPSHVASMTGSNCSSSSSAAASTSCSTPPHRSLTPDYSGEKSNQLQDYSLSSAERANQNQDYRISTPPQSSAISTSTPWATQNRGPSPSGSGHNMDRPSPSVSPQDIKSEALSDTGQYASDDASYSSFPSVNLKQPVLLDHQITAISAAAALLAQELPPLEPKTLPKKQVSKEITTVMLMANDEPNRMDAMRKYGAIYGRFDSKRKNDRPMSLHEISVNEAAAQLCSHIPALLTRREELFPLARQVVRDSGYQYSKGHSRAAEIILTPKLEPGDSHSAVLPPAIAPLTPGHEDTYILELENELNQVNLSLSEMHKEQNRIRSALRVLLEANDHDQMRALTSEMDDLNDRQSVLIKTKQKLSSFIAKYKKGLIKAPLKPPSLPFPSCSATSKPNGGQNSNSISTGPNIKLNNNITIGKSEDKSGIIPVISSSNASKIVKHAGSAITATPTQPGGSGSNSLNTLYMAALQNHKDSLFEEGLRIATQYGMNDFAQELLGMKSQEKLKDKVGDSDDSGINLANGDSNNATSFHEASASAPSSLSSSLLFTSSSTIPSSSDSISASSGEYLAPASKCPIHSHSATSSSSPLPPPQPPPLQQPLLNPLAASTPSGSPPPFKAVNRSPSHTLIQTSPKSKHGSKNSIHKVTAKLATSSPGALPSSPPLPIPPASSSPKITNVIANINNNNNNNNNIKSISPSSSSTAAMDVSPSSSSSPLPSPTSTIAQGSTTTTTTITTKTGQVIEVETRRSSRRKNGEPDYYLINGGEKRFRSSNQRRSSSTSSERVRRLSSSSSTSSVTGLSISSPSKPYTLEQPCPSNKNKVAQDPHGQVGCE